MTSFLNQGGVRRQNASAVLKAVHRAGPLSRAALTAHTRLNRSTVGDLVAELDRRGLVREGEPDRRTTRGRPSPLVHTRTDGVVVLAAEIEVDSLTVATVGLGGRIQGRASLGHRPGRLGPAETIADLVELARPLLHRLPAGKVVGVGVGVAGMVRAEDGFVHIAPNLGWHDVPLKSLLCDELGLEVPVFVGNEADLGAMAEHLRVGAEVRNLIYVSGEVGIGAGVIVNDRLLAGAAGYAGAVGHIPINPHGLACRCGSQGCWETEAGERALLRHAGYDATTGGREAVERLLRSAAAADPETLRVMDIIGRWLGIGLAGLVNIFNPQRVVMGGLFAEIHPYVAQVVERELDMRALSAPRSIVEVVAASLGTESTLLGAAELALAPVLADPTSIAVKDGSPLAEASG